MRTQINHVEIYNSRISSVRDWKSRKRVKMDGKQIKRCAKELGISSTAVKDCLNALETTKLKTQRTGV